MSVNPMAHLTDDELVAIAAGGSAPVIPVDLDRLDYRGAAPAEAGWYAASCQETGKRIVMLLKGTPPRLPEGWVFGPMLARHRE